jgi:hypothetical protein
MLSAAVVGFVYGSAEVVSFDDTTGNELVGLGPVLVVVSLLVKKKSENAIFEKQPGGSSFFRPRQRLLPCPRVASFGHHYFENENMVGVSRRLMPRRLLQNGD